MRKKERFKRNRLQRTTTINIEVDQHGHFFYTDENGLPAYYHGVKGPRPGEKVHIIWWAEDATATLTIAFKNDSPCESKTFKSKTNFVKAKVRQTAVPKAYGYDVVYSVGGKNYKDDPQIIIN